jgi:hypothetical protein
MALPAYDPEQLNALARVFAEAALDELIRDADDQAAADRNATGDGGELERQSTTGEGRAA